MTVEADSQGVKEETFSLFTLTRQTGFNQAAVSR